MKHIETAHFYSRLYDKEEQRPYSGQLELTYRCDLDCIHCYCKGSEEVPSHRSQVADHRSKLTEETFPKKKELTTIQWKRILDEVQKEGCLCLTLTGGEPLIRDDFLEIYGYAKRLGFIITIFTNGQSLTNEIIDYLEKYPPFSIEITLNGITKNTYESITRVDGSFERVMENIRALRARRLPLIIKANCLKQNRHEIAKIKQWAEDLLGKSAKMTEMCDVRPETCDIRKYNFKYDPMIFPRLNGDRAPCEHRLSFEELTQLRRQDPDIWGEYREGCEAGLPDLTREARFLYRCNAWMKHFFINPYGRLKFCQFSEKFSVDLRETSFHEGFYRAFPKLLTPTFTTDSRCQHCSLRPLCYHCPARAYLETGNEEAPVPYYCELAKHIADQIKLLNC
ncbi:MAG: radical SAM protein [Candidatus Omnitrophica bacterium]|nr:radical SAM protein [Candidatus Omnitrophota bacterium]